VIVAHVVLRGQAIAPALRAHLSTASPELPADAAAWRRAAADETKWLARAESRAEAHLLGAQATAEALGLRVLSRYTTTAMGLLVQGSAEAVERLGRHRDVLAVQPAPVARPAIAVSTHDVGAERTRARLGLDGADTVIAVVDTGIDYTHAAFDGPGEVAAWQAATTAVDAISETWMGAPLFPGPRVNAGHDFAGFGYAVPEDCPEADPDACLPQPDPDPIEEPVERVTGPSASGHGTHVAAIAAGNGPSASQRGVAPAAQVAALKIFGGRAAGSALVPAALEWIARVNLGLDVPGTAPGRIDVVNLSLGELYPGPGLALLDEQVAELLALGVTVVAAAGNDGGRPFSILAPGASAGALSVASVENEPVRGEIHVEDALGATSGDGVAAAFAPPLSDFGILTGPLEAVEDPCGQPTLTRGAIALAAQGGCRPEVIASALQALGASAVLLESPGNAPALRLTGEATDVTRPTFAVAAAEGAIWRAALDAGRVLSATLDPALQSGSRGPSDFAARGPAANGALKPDLAAPGRRISAARSGSGRGTRIISGSSMSAPHAAGAAALLRQSARQQGWSLSALEIGALLKSTARPPTGPPAPGPAANQARPVRVGAGLLAVDRAVAAGLSVRAGALAEIDLGALSLAQASDEPVVLTRTVDVRELWGIARELRIEAEISEDLNGAMALQAPADAIPIAAGGSVAVAVTITLRPAALPAPEPLRAARVDAADLAAREAFGRITVREASTDGETPNQEPLHGLPVYAFLTRAAQVEVRDVAAPPPSQVALSQASGLRTAQNDTQVHLSNRGAIAGEAVLLRRAGVSPPGWRVGAGWWSGEGGEAALEIVAAGAQGLAADWLAYPAAWLDLDQDGQPEWRVDLRERPLQSVGQNYPTGMAAEILLQRVDATGAAMGAARTLPAPVALHSQLLRLRIPLASLALAAPVDAALWLSPARWAPPSAGAAPGRPPGGSAFMRLPADAMATRVVVEPAQETMLTMPSTAARMHLWLLPENSHVRPWAQSTTLGATPIYLPRASVRR
jgi:subtilisin family serine protease